MDNKSNIRKNTRRSVASSRIKKAYRKIVAGLVAVGWTTAVYFGLSGSIGAYMDPPKVTFGCLTEETYRFVSKNSVVITAASLDYNVHPALIGATILNENECRMRLYDMLDMFGVVLGTNPSIGVGQVRVETAKELYEKYMHQKISEADVVDLLKDPLWNIQFIAMFYRNEMDHSRIDADQQKNPEVIVDLITRYIGGRNNKSVDAKIAGYNGLLHITDERLWKSLGMKADLDVIDKIRNFAKSRREKMKNLYEKTRKFYELQ